MTNLKFIDLFAGIGGFRQALDNCGFECVFSNDNDKNCIKTYKENYGHINSENIENVDEKEIPNFDILCGGFPCQPFSKAGQQKGFQDCRGNLFFEICRIIKHHLPKYIILENVRNLASHDKGNTWEVMRSKLQELGYSTYAKPVILNTLYFGIPQSRERVVVMGKRLDLGKLPNLPNITKESIKPTNLKSIIDDEVDTKYNIDEKLFITEKIWNNFLKILKNNNIKIPKFPIWTDWWDSEGSGTRITKKDKKKTDEENEILIKKKQVDFYKKYTSWIEKNREFYNNNVNILKPWLEDSRKYELWKGAVRKLEWQAGDVNLLMNEVLWSPRGSGIRIKNLDYSPTLVAMTSMTPIYGPKSRHFTP